MLDRNPILSRMDLLKGYLKFLDEVKEKDEKEYVNNPYIYGSAERFLHLAIECVVDIGNHMIADQKLRKPEDNKDIFIILMEENIITAILAEKLMKMAGFRNLLVHGYTKLNRSIIYSILQDDLHDIDEFVKQIAEYIS